MTETTTEPDHVLPWERRDHQDSSLWRWARTAGELLFEPHVELVRAPHGDAGAALRFAVLMSFASYTPIALACGVGIGLIAALPSSSPPRGQHALIIASVVVFVLAPAIITAWRIGAAYLLAWLYHRAAIALGGIGAYPSSVRAMLYAQATTPRAAMSLLASGCCCCSGTVFSWMAALLTGVIVWGTRGAPIA